MDPQQLGPLGFGLGITPPPDVRTAAVAKMRAGMARVRAEVDGARKVFRGHLTDCLAECRDTIADCRACLVGLIDNRLSIINAVVQKTRDRIRGGVAESLAFTGDRLLELYRAVPEAAASSPILNPAPPEPLPPPPPPAELAQSLADAGELYRQLIETPGALSAIGAGGVVALGAGDDALGSSPLGVNPGGGGVPTGPCPPGYKCVLPVGPGCAICQKIVPPPPPPPPPPGSPGSCEPVGGGDSTVGCTWTENGDGTNTLGQVVYYYNDCGCVTHKAVIPVSVCWCKMGGTGPGCSMCVHCTEENPCPPELCPEGWSVDDKTGMCQPPPEQIECEDGFIVDPVTGQCVPIGTPTGCPRPDDAAEDAELLSNGDGTCTWTDPDGTPHGDPCPNPDDDPDCPLPEKAPCSAKLVTLPGGYKVWQDDEETSYPPRCAPKCGLAAVCAMPDDAPDNAVLVPWDDGTVQWFDPEEGQFYGEPCELDCPFPEDAPLDACLVQHGDPPCWRWVGPDGKLYGVPCPVDDGDPCVPELAESPDPRPWDLGEADGSIQWPEEPRIYVPEDDCLFEGR